MARVARTQRVLRGESGGESEKSRCRWGLVGCGLKKVYSLF